MSEVISPPMAVYAHSDTVNVSIYKTDGSVVVSGAACTEIGTSGRFYYQPVFAPPATKTTYLIVFTNSVYEQTGELVLGGYDYQVAAIMPASPANEATLITLHGHIDDILADTSEVQGELTDGGRTDLLIDGIASKTTNLPSSPAAVGSAMTVSDKTGFSLSTASILAIWDQLLTAITAAGSVGKLIKDNLNDTITSRLAASSYVASDNAAITAIHGHVDDILADTSEIQGELADGGRTDLLVDGIAAKTVNLPASPAAVGSAMTLSADQAVNVTKWNGHAVLEAVEGSPVATLGAAQAAYAPSKAGDKMDLVDTPNSTGIGAIVTAIWDKLLTGITLADSIGKLLKDNINAAIGSRSSHSAADVWLASTRALTDKSGFSGSGTVTDKTGFSLATAPPTKEDIADAVCDEALGTHSGFIATNLNAKVGDVASAIAALDIPTVAENQAGLMKAADYVAPANADLTTLLSRITAARAGYLDLLNTYLDAKVSSATAPTVLAIDAQLSSVHGAGKWDQGSGSGSGSTLKTYTQTVAGQPLAGCEVWVSTDLLQQNIIAGGVTDALGKVYLHPDVPVGTTLYIWRWKVGYEFVNPDLEQM